MCDRKREIKYGIKSVRILSNLEQKKTFCILFLWIPIHNNILGINLPNCNVQITDYYTTVKLIIIHTIYI